MGKLIKSSGIALAGRKILDYGKFEVRFVIRLIRVLVFCCIFYFLSSYCSSTKTLSSFSMRLSPHQMVLFQLTPAQSEEKAQKLRAMTRQSRLLKCSPHPTVQNLCSPKIQTCSHHLLLYIRWNCSHPSMIPYQVDTSAGLTSCCLIFFRNKK